MNFKELYDRLDNICSKDLSCEWDNDGIMCMPDPMQTVKKVLISLDITEDVVDFAIKNRFDTIISHHPLVFNSQKSLSVEKFTQRKLIKLVKANINAMSFHTRLDAMNGGVNDTLCKVLELTDVEKDVADPIGRIGYLKEKMSLQDFAKYVKDKLSSSCVLYSGDENVSRIYIVGGDGKDLISNAIANGADTLLTGRASYNTAIDACDMGLNIVEAGHFFTENPVCDTLKNILLDIDDSIETNVYFSNKIEIIK